MLMRLGIVVVTGSTTLLLLLLFDKDLVSLEGTGGEVSILIRLGITGGPTSPLSVSGLVRTRSGTH